MRVVPIPLLEDNYGYAVIADDGVRAAVVDPSEAAPVLAALGAMGARLEAIWLTHHHGDHTGGVEDLCRAVPNLTVVGSAYDREHGRIPGQNVAVDDTDGFDFAGHGVRVLAIPGHTLGAIAYWIGDELFTGDTLFLSGCGRVFEGTMDMMEASLRKLRGLPGRTRLWCGHEYTEKNLAFAASVEPTNEDIETARRRAADARSAGRPTVPWTLDEDRKVNPFLRYDLPSLATGRAPVESFAYLRAQKDTFR